jgi:hypothetical protein
MSDSEELARKERRRRLIERLNETEKLLGAHGQGRPSQMSEEELAAEIEKQRTLNAARRGGFSF